MNDFKQYLAYAGVSSPSSSLPLVNTIITHRYRNTKMRRAVYLRKPRKASQSTRSLNNNKNIPSNMNYISKGKKFKNKPCWTASSAGFLSFYSLGASPCCFSRRVIRLFIGVSGLQKMEIEGQSSEAHESVIFHWSK